MGMDVIGKKPTDEKGEYFRNSGWWWSPLWDFCSYVAPETCGKVKYAYSNSGDGLGALDSKKLSKALYTSLKDGTANKYIKGRKKYIKSLPMRKCVHCRATGTRQWLKTSEDEYRSAWNYEYLNDLMGDGQKLPKYKRIKAKKNEKLVNEKCNVCDGKSKVEPWQAGYQIDEENIKNFARFLKTCGGFAIW